MRINKTDKLIIFLLTVSCLFVATVNAATHRVTPKTPDIQTLLDRANDGDRVLFSAGHYNVHLIIKRSLVLNAEPGAVLDGGGEGDVIRVRAANVVIRGFQIRNSGHDLTEMNAGIFIDPSAKNILVENNYLDANGFGIWLDACMAPRILNNRIHGEPQRRSQDRGNGIHLYATKQGVIEGNEVWQTRDGIYIDTSKYNTLQQNVLHDLRYGIHYMYSYYNRVIDNHTYHTRTGYALMQSKYLTVIGNTSDKDRNYGMLLNFITNSTIMNNRIRSVRQGTGYATGGADVLGAEGKAIFIYNSQFNELHHNLFIDSDIGIHLTAGSEDNQIYGNAFIGNRSQVKYVANRTQDWTWNGRGNYWSDYLGWDLDANGIGDKQYEPNDAVDKLLWKYPMARILMNSPAVETLRWVQQQFPVLKPQGVRDSAPLMHTTYIKEKPQ